MCHVLGEAYVKQALGVVILPQRAFLVRQLFELLL